MSQIEKIQPFWTIISRDPDQTSRFVGFLYHVFVGLESVGSENETMFFTLTCRTFFSSTAGQSFQNTKWPAVLYSVHFAWLFLIDIWQFGLAGLFRFMKFTENIWPAVELKKVLSVTKHGFVFWAQRKPNARLEIYKAFQDRLTFLNRHMII